MNYFSPYLSPCKNSLTSFFDFHHTPQGEGMQFCPGGPFSQSNIICKAQRLCLIRRRWAQCETQWQLCRHTTIVLDVSLSVTVYLV